GEQDVLAEAVQRNAGVARQPVLDDLGLFLHGARVNPRAASFDCARKNAPRPIRARSPPQPPAARHLAPPWPAARFEAMSRGEPSMLRTLTAALAATLLAGCASTAAKSDAPDGAASATSGASAFTADPYPSTYRPIASPPVLITGATVLTGS